MLQRWAVSTARVCSLADTSGALQIVATAGRIVLDLQTRNYDTNGQLRFGHTVAYLTPGVAIDIRNKLSKAIVDSATLVPGSAESWSDETDGVHAGWVGWTHSWEHPA